MPGPGRARWRRWACCEVTLIGGEAYLRDDWLEIVRAIRDAGMQCSMTTGGRGITAERARAAARGRAAERQRLDRRQRGDARSAARRGGRYRSALAAAGHLRAAGVGVSVNTQINRLSMRELPDVLETIIALGARGLADAAHRRHGPRRRRCPRCCCSRKICWSCSRCWRG